MALGFGGVHGLWGFRGLGFRGFGFRLGFGGLGVLGFWGTTVTKRSLQVKGLGLSA